MSCDRNYWAILRYRGPGGRGVPQELLEAFAGDPAKVKSKERDDEASQHVWRRLCVTLNLS